jgi:hypothetical protein
MMRLICLANSRRDGGRCIAGIDMATGRWIRPIPPKGGAIQEEKTFLSGNLITPLDIIELELDAPNFNTRYQCENQTVRNWHWRLVDKVKPADVVKYCIKSGRVLFSNSKIVDPADMEKLQPEKWTSLELIHATNVRFEPDPRKTIRWQAKFSSGRYGLPYCLTITDPEITIRLNRKEKIKPECLLTVSLTEPIEFKEYKKPPLCYKLAAAVIEL